MGRRRRHRLLSLLPILVLAVPPTSGAEEAQQPPAESPPAAEGAASEGSEEPSGKTESSALPEQEGAQQGESTEEPQEGSGETPEATEETEEEAATEPQEPPESPPGEAAPPAPQLSPAEQERIEELKRKREERAAKRAAKKARQAAKEEQKRLEREAKHAERLAEILSEGGELLEAGRLDKARQAFEKHMELEGGESYDGHMGLARVELAAANPAAAVEQALKAVQASGVGADKARALSFAAEATSAARPRDEETGEPLPGTGLYRNNALRYYMQALTFDPEGALEARQALEQAFPAPEDERTERFYSRYLESSETAAQAHAKRLASTYEALLSGRIEGPLAVAGGITAPEKTSGPQPPYPQDLSAENIRRRLVIALVVEADGTVSKARILNGLDTPRDRAAEAVMGQWTFEPARLPDGAPVAVYYVIVTNADVQPLPVPEVEAPPAAETAAEETAAEQTSGETPDEQTSAAEGPSGEAITEEAPAGEAPAAEEETAGEPAGGEPAGDESTGDEPPADGSDADTSGEASPPQSGGALPDEPQTEDDQGDPQDHQ